MVTSILRHGAHGARRSSARGKEKREGMKKRGGGNRRPQWPAVAAVAVVAAASAVTVCVGAPMGMSKARGLGAARGRVSSNFPRHAEAKRAMQTLNAPAEEDGLRRLMAIRAREGPRSRGPQPGRKLQADERGRSLADFFGRDLQEGACSYSQEDQFDGFVMKDDDIAPPVDEQAFKARSASPSAKISSDLDWWYAPWGVSDSDLGSREGSFYDRCIRHENCVVGWDNYLLSSYCAEDSWYWDSDDYPTCQPLENCCYAQDWEGWGQSVDGECPAGAYASLNTTKSECVTSSSGWYSTTLFECRSHDDCMKGAYCAEDWWGNQICKLEHVSSWESCWTDGDSIDCNCPTTDPSDYDWVAPCALCTKHSDCDGVLASMTSDGWYEEGESGVYCREGNSGRGKCAEDWWYTDWVCGAHEYMATSSSLSKEAMAKRAIQALIFSKATKALAERPEKEAANVGANERSNIGSYTSDYWSDYVSDYNAFFSDLWTMEGSGYSDSSDWWSDVVSDWEGFWSDYYHGEAGSDYSSDMRAYWSDYFTQYYSDFSGHLGSNFTVSDWSDYWSDQSAYWSDCWTRYYSWSDDDWSDFDWSDFDWSDHEWSDVYDESNCVEVSMSLCCSSMDSIDCTCPMLNGESCAVSSRVYSAGVDEFDSAMGAGGGATDETAGDTLADQIRQAGEWDNLSVLCKAHLENLEDDGILDEELETPYPPMGRDYSDMNNLCLSPLSEEACGLWENFWSAYMDIFWATFQLDEGSCGGEDVSIMLDVFFDGLDDGLVYMCNLNSYEIDELDACVMDSLTAAKESTASQADESFSAAGTLAGSAAVVGTLAVAGAVLW